MLEKLLKELHEFVKERLWHVHHHPKNLVGALLVEITELAEHFIPETPISKEELLCEIGDVNNILLLTKDNLQVSLPENTPPSNLSITSQVLDLIRKSGLLYDHFLWMTDEESRSYQPIEEVSALYAPVYRAFITLTATLGIDPIAAGFQKLSLHRKKYPKELIAGNLNAYYERKKAWRKNPPESFS
jgi:hypothetical protein